MPAVGGAGIDLTPEWLKHFAIQRFGTYDMQVLLGTLAAGVTVLAVLIGLAARRRMTFGLAGMTGFAVLGVAAAVTRPDAGVTDALPALAGEPVPPR